MKIKRQSAPRLRSSLCQGPAARLWIQEFESSLGSQAVGSPGFYFPVCENPRHFRGLGWRAPVSGGQFSAFPSFGRGFRAPVSARHFPISVSAERGLVRLLTETGSRNVYRASGATPARSLQPRSALLSKSYLSCLQPGVASSSCIA